MLVILPTDDKKKRKRKSLSVPLFNPKPPVAFSFLAESLFLGLDSQLHPGTLRALCDSGDKEEAATKVSKHTHCTATHLEKHVRQIYLTPAFSTSEALLNLIAL